MTLPKLYKKSSTGAILEWSIEIERNKYRTHSGQVDGAITTTEWTTTEGKNVGRSNETSPEEQAILEAKAKYQKQIDRGYSDKIALAKEGVTRLNRIFPMLAKEYKKRKKYVKFPALSQRKYDGIRSNLSKEWIKSKEGKDFVSVPHIVKISQKLFESYPDIIFDGELYNHELKEDFNAISSIVKTQNPTEEDLIKSEQIIRYYMYDLAIPDLSIQDRQKLIDRLFIEFPQLSKYFIRCGTDFVNSQEELDSLYEQYLSEGYEGQMIRFIDSKYEFGKRSPNLLKRKETQDEEFRIIDILSGKGNKANIAAKVIIRSLDGKMECLSNIKGSHSFCKELLDNKDQYIGKIGTVQFQNYTPAGKLRFPYLKAIRDYE